MRLSRAGLVGGAIYAALGVAWLALRPPGPAWAYIAWVAMVVAAAAILPGVANQVSLARAFLAAPALAYSVAGGYVGALAVVVAFAGLSDLVDGTIARRFDEPSNLGGGLDPVVDGIFLGSMALGLAIGGAFPLWLALVVNARYVLPALVASVLLARGRSPKLHHTLSGQVSTALILVLLGGIALFRYLGQDATNVVVGAAIVIPIATIATFVHLGMAAGATAAEGAGPDSA